MKKLEKNINTIIIGGKVKPCSDLVLMLSGEVLDQMIEKQGRAQFTILDYGKYLVLETTAGNGTTTK
jgi:hypothetical protein